MELRNVFLTMISFNFSTVLFCQINYNEECYSAIRNQNLLN